MARQVLPIVGAVVGSFLGSPQIGFMIGSLVGNAVDPVRMRGPSIGEGQATTTQEGLARPIVWGAGVVGANIIDRGELKKSVKRSSAKGGPTRDDEQFHLTYALRICEGPIQGIVRIWENEKLVYDIRPDGVSQISTEDNSNYAKKFRLYLGDDEQMPDSALEAIHGVGNTPAYRGTAYVVFENADVTHTGGAVPTYRFEVLAGGGEVKEQGSYAFSGRYRGVETDDGWDIIEQVPPITLGTSGGLYKTYVVTNDGKFILTAGSTTATATVYKLNPDTLSYELLGTIKDVIPDYPEISGVIFATRMVISDDGSTIVVGRHSSNRALLRYTVLKYNERTESFTYADTFNAEESNVSSIAIDSDGSSFVALGRVGSNLAKFFLSGSGMRIGYKLIPQGANFSNSPQIIIPSGEKSFVSSVVSFSGPGDRIGYTFTGVTPYDDTHTYARPIKADFPGYSPISGSNAPMYYVESKYGGGKVLFFMRSDTTPYHFILASYEIVSGIPVPGIPALIPKIEYTSPDGWGWIATTTGGNFRDITAMSGTSQSPQSGWVRFYKFKLDYDSGVISLEKYEDYANTPIGSSIANRWYYQLPVSASQANTGDGISYQWFVDDVLDRSDLPPEKYATDELADYSIRGVVAAEQYTAGEIIRSTQPVFPIDVADYDRNLHFTKRGKPAVAAITIDEMLDGTYDFTRNEALEYPRKLNLIYQHQRTGYVSAKATVERISPDVRVSGETTTQVPVVMDENQAAQSADILLKTSWTDLEGEVKFSVPSSFDFLTVGDCVAIYPRSGQQYRMRIETIERADGRLDIKGKIDRQNSYNSQVTGLPIPDPTPPPPTTVGPTRLAYLDIPALTDADDALVYYVAVNGETEAWSGAETQRRIVPDDFEEVARYGLGQAVGTLTQTLAVGPEHYADTTSSIYVHIPGEHNAPESLTDDQMLRERNVLAISRPDGSAELVQFRDVEELGGGNYRLSYLLRGQLYTGVDEHMPGATVTLLDYGFSKVQVDASMLEAEWQHRAVSFGDTPEAAVIRTDTYAARSQVEFPPGLLKGVVNGSDIDLTWSHTFRFGSDTHPVDSVNRTGYLVEVSDGSGVITQELGPGETSVSVDASSLSGTLTVSVSGINRYTGNGIPSIITLDL